MEIPVNEATSGAQSFPVVAGLTGGGFVAWYSEGDIKARVFNAAGTALTGDLDVAQFPVGTQAAPDVTSLSDGGFLVAWTTNTSVPADGGDGSGSSIKARAFSSTGAPTSAELLVNAVTTADQQMPAAATLADGRVIISWTDRSNAQLQQNDVRAQILDPRTQGVNVSGTADADKYVGSAFVDTLSGLGGSDLLDGGAGGDALVGGDGDDIYIIDQAGDSVAENAAAGNDTVFSLAHFALSANVENLILQGGTDLQGFGNGLANTINGNSGNNLLDGGAGADTMSGGAGNDTYFVDNAADAVVEGAGQGNDTVFSTAHLVLAANVETLVLQGGADLQGFGNGMANVIYGNTGNNLLDGGTGADLMVGGAGNDTYFVDNSSDAAFENAGEGHDAVFASTHYGLAADVEILVQQGTADLQGYGSNQANTLHGNAGNNLLNGAGGADTMRGGAGNDTYFVDNGGDVVVENPGEGADAVFSTVHFILPTNVETLVLQGGVSANGTGNALANSIFGDSSHNRLDGQGNTDTLTGNAGNDTFVFVIGQGNATPSSTSPATGRH